MNRLKLVALMVLLWGAVATTSPAQETGTSGTLLPAPHPGEVRPTVQALRADLYEILSPSGTSTSQWGVLVVSLVNGDTLFAHAPDHPLVPASNVKVFTTAAALYYLGPDYRYKTFLLADGDIRHGVLEGDLIVYGTGDPTLRGAENRIWQTFADSLAARGVREVRGALIGDGSYFVGPGTGIGWRETYMSAAFAAPASALSFNENIARLNVLPGDGVGRPVQARLVPSFAGIGIVNHGTTARGNAARVSVERETYDGPLLLRGEMGINNPGVWRLVPIVDGPLYAVSSFRELLEDKGIRISGETRSVIRPEDSPLSTQSVFTPIPDSFGELDLVAFHRSVPLLEILEELNRRSHNMYSEMVFRSIGRVAYGRGTVEAAEQAVYAMLEREAGLTHADLQIMDGSGLSPLNRTSPGTLLKVLDFMAHSRHWAAFRSTLPEAGAEPSFRRMRNTAAAGNLRAKTGTIDGVSALSGYVHTADGELLGFSIISNGLASDWRAKRLEDAIGARLAGFSRREGGPAVSASERMRALPAWATNEAKALRQHTIRPGDTLESIANRYGITVRDLESVNPGIQPRRLIPGNRLRLP